MSIEKLLISLCFSFVFLGAGVVHASPCDTLPLDFNQLIKEAAKGDDYCQAILALEYTRGTSGTIDEEKYAAIAVELANSDEPIAIYVAASLFRTGSESLEIEKNEKRSKKMNSAFRAMVDPELLSDPNLLMALGFIRRYGRDNQPADIALGCSYFFKAAELGHPHAMYQTSLCIRGEYVDGATEQDELYWLKKSSDLGHPEATWMLGEMNLEAKEKNVALDLFELAATYGDPEFYVRLGGIYEAGQIYSPDWVKASEAYAKASDAGNGLASYRLGWLHLTGYPSYSADNLGFAKDFDAAISAFKLAQAQGNQEAARVLDALK